jgi:hypothetical protein
VPAGHLSDPKFASPTVKEVCVKKVYPLRVTAEGGQEKYEQFFKQFNDSIHE